MSLRFRDRKTGEEYALEKFEDGYRLELSFATIEDWKRFYPIARGARLKKISTNKPSLKSLEDLDMM